MIARWELCPSSESLVDRSGSKSALKLVRKLLKKQGITPTTVVTDKLGSYSGALREFEVPRRHDTGRWRNNRADVTSSSMTNLVGTPAGVIHVPRLLMGRVR
jgi:transposase-like protein